THRVPLLVPHPAIRPWNRHVHGAVPGMLLCCRARRLHARVRTTAHRFPRRATVERMKILIAGASGLIGTALQSELRTRGHEVRTLVRRPARGESEYRWQPDERHLPQQAVEWADGVVNLSGAPLGRLP